MFQLFPAAYFGKVGTLWYWNAASCRIPGETHVECHLGEMFSLLCVLFSDTSYLSLKGLQEKKALQGECPLKTRRGKRVLKGLLFMNVCISEVLL